MHKSKLLDLIRGLDKEELRLFRLFILSPYFNKRSELLDLYDYIINLAPDFSEDLLKREYVYQSLYPEKEYNEKEITYMMSFLSKLIEQFLGQRRYEEQKELMKIHQLESLMQHGLDKHYKYVLKQLEKYFEQKEIIDTTHYYNLQQLHYIQNQYYIKKGGRTYDANLQDAADYLDLFYFGKKLQYICSMENRKRMTQKSYGLGFSEGLFQYVQRSDLLGNPLIKVYYHIAKSLISEEAESHFQEILAILENGLSSFNEVDKEEILLHGINYSVEKIPKTHQVVHYAAICLNIYQIGLDTKLFIKNGILPYWHFKNIIKLSLGLERFEYVEHFINEYGEILAEEHRENLLVYSLAELNYARKDYDKAMGYIRQVSYSKDIYYQLNAKSMLARIYFETGEEELLLSFLASFKLFLRRNKKYSKTKITSHLNFCNTLSRIMRKNPARKESIKEQIENSQLIADKRWLLRALEQTLPD